MKKVVFMAGLALALSGCSTGEMRYVASTMLPDLTWRDPPPLVVDAEHAKVVLQSAGDANNPVAFSVWRGDATDRSPEPLGTVGRYATWLGLRTKLELQADPGQTLLVQGSSRLDGRKPAPGYLSEYTTEQVFNSSTNKWEQKQVQHPTVPTSYSCGPIGGAFVPEKQKVYLAEFVFIYDGKGCELHVYDITAPAQRLPVTVIKGRLSGFAEASVSP